MATTCSIGIDVGGTKILGLVVDPSRPAEAVATREVHTPPGPGPLVAELTAMVAQLSAEVGERRLTGVGVGMPGLVNGRGVLRLGPNLPGVLDVDLVALLGEQVGVPVAVDNDANCAAWGEVRVGAARGHRNAIFVGLGTGIGGGFVVDGALMRGANGFAAEPGHMTVAVGGERCACGRLGCWEAYASGTGLGRMAARAASEGRAPAILAAAGGDPTTVRGEHLAVALHGGDPVAAALMDEFARWVGLGLSNLVSLLDPDVVVLGGTMVEIGEALLLPIRRAMLEFAFAADVRKGPPIVPASLGRLAGGIGAALLPGVGPVEA